MLKKFKNFHGFFSPTAASLILDNKLISDTIDILELRGTGFTSLKPKILSSFLNSKKKIILFLAKLSHFHLITFFANLILSSVLEHLEIESQDLTIVSPSTLCMTISKLKSVKLINVKMTYCQKRAIKSKFPQKMCHNFDLQKNLIKSDLLNKVQKIKQVLQVKNKGRY